jgi:hypothetical protein
MKNSMLLMLSLLVSFSFGSCKKETEGDPETLDAEQVAEAIASSLSTSTTGMLLQVQDVADYTAKVAAAPSFCSVSKDSSFTRTSQPGSTITYSYKFEYHYAQSCPNNERKIELHYLGAGQYHGPRMSSDDAASASFTITNIHSGSYTFNGTYSRNGTQVSKVRNQNSFTSSLIVTFDQLSVDRSSRRVMSGTATVEFLGEGTNGRSFTYTGQLTFTGDQKANLKIGTRMFLLDLATGRLG